LTFWSMVFAVLFTTTNPAPVGPEWPHMDPGSTVLGKPGQKFATSRLPPAQLQVVPTTVTRGSDFTTQLSSSSGAVVGTEPLPAPDSCVVNCGPKGAQTLGATQAVTGTEPELLVARPCGSLLPVLSDASGRLAPLAGGAPNCRILPRPGVNCDTKAYVRVEYVPTLIRCNPTPNPLAKSALIAPLAESKRNTRPPSVVSSRLTPWVASTGQMSMPTGNVPRNSEGLTAMEVGLLRGLPGFART